MWLGYIFADILLYDNKVIYQEHAIASHLLLQCNHFNKFNFLKLRTVEVANNFITGWNIKHNNKILLNTGYLFLYFGIHISPKTVRHSFI